MILLYNTCLIEKSIRANKKEVLLIGPPLQSRYSHVFYFEVEVSFNPISLPDPVHQMKDWRQGSGQKQHQAYTMWPSTTHNVPQKNYNSKYEDVSK